MRREDHEYHVGRARAELDWAYRATASRVAEAHMRLSALRMQCLKRLDEGCSGADLG
jgi:hypothetical protein